MRRVLVALATLAAIFYIIRWGTVMLAFAAGIMIGIWWRG